MIRSIVLFFLFSHIAFAAQNVEGPPLNIDTEHRFKISYDVFPISSEIQIGKIKHLIEMAPKGMLITVGSERGFRAASMMKQITYLWLLDYSNEIIQYNLINRELLKSPSRQQYLHLRWKASLTEWKALSNKLNKDDFKWWEQNVRDIQNAPYRLPEYLNRYHKSPRCDGEEISDPERKVNMADILDYKTGNYLFHDDLYQNIHKLALQNKIFVSKVNLKSTEQMDKISHYLKTHNLTIGVLDLDNLYYNDYLGQDIYHKVLKRFLPHGKDNSMLIVMSNYKDYACGQYQFYLGFTFENIRNWPEKFKMQNFILSIPPEVPDLMDGKYYEKKDPLPRF